MTTRALPLRRRHTAEAEARGAAAETSQCRGETEKKQKQTLARRGFNVNASVPRHKREYTNARVRFIK